MDLLPVTQQANFGLDPLLVPISKEGPFVVFSKTGLKLRKLALGLYAYEWTRGPLWYDLIRSEQVNVNYVISSVLLNSIHQFL